MLQKVFLKLLPNSSINACIALVLTSIAFFILYFTPPQFILSKPQQYSDIIASHLTWGDQKKSNEIIFIYWITCLSFFSFFSFSLLLNYLNIFKSNNRLVIFDKLKSISGEKALELLNNTILCIAATSSVLFISSKFLIEIKITPASNIILFTACLLLSIFLRTNSLVERITIITAKILIPFLIFRFIQFDFLLDGNEFTHRLSYFGIIFFSSAFLLAMILTIYSIKKNYKDISPVQVVILATYFTFSIPTNSLFSYDSYHIGEMLIPFEQIFKFNLVYGENFISVHGLLALSYGFIHNLFFGATYAQVPYSFILTNTLYTALLAGALCISLPSRISLILGIFILPGWNRFNLIPFLFSILVCKKVYANTTLWLLVASILSITALMFNYAPGLSIVLSILPFLFLRSFEINNKISLLLIAISVLIFSYFSSTYLLGAVKFIVNNWEGTQAGFGISIFEIHEIPGILKSIQIPKSVSFFISCAYKFFKLYGWIFASLIMLCLFSTQEKKNNSIFFAVCFICLVAISMIPYSYGRIGTEGLGRIGALSVIYSGLFLPFIYLYEKQVVSFVSFLVIVTATLIMSFHHLKYLESPFLLATRKSNISAKFNPEPNKLKKVQGMGNAFVTDQELEKQIDFSNFIRQHAPDPANSYFDFTNQQNFFFIHKKPTPYAYPSHVVALNHKTQNQIIDQLNKMNPSFIWVSPSQDYEFFNASLRSYRVYKWILLSRYTSVVKSPEKNFTFLLKNTTSTPPSEGDLQELSKFFLNPDLGLLPKAWARNWNLLMHRFNVNQTRLGVNKGSTVEFSLDTEINGSENDFLYLRIPSYVGKIKLSFSANNRIYQSSEFSTDPFHANEYFLIPLGGDPRWLLADKIQKITLHLENTEYDIGGTKITFLKLLK